VFNDSSCTSGTWPWGLNVNVRRLHGITSSRIYCPDKTTINHSPPNIRWPLHRPAVWPPSPCLDLYLHGKTDFPRDGDWRRYSCVVKGHSSSPEIAPATPQFPSIFFPPFPSAPRRSNPQVANCCVLRRTQWHSAGRRRQFWGRLAEWQQWQDDVIGALTASSIADTDRRTPRQASIKKHSAIIIIWLFKNPKGSNNTTS